MFSLFSLLPGTEYTVGVQAEGETLSLTFVTEAETFFVDASRYGLVADGETDNTGKLQAALSTCPKGGTVYVPAGRYETAQKVLANLITLFLGLSIAATMSADKFLRPQTLLVLGLGLVAFVFDTVGGVFFAKFINLFAKKKINPMIGAAGISAFPMSARVVHKLGQEEDNQNFLLMHAVGANVSGQIASVIAGGLILSIFGSMLG